jgi:hypothetical protein
VSLAIVSLGPQPQIRAPRWAGFPRLSHLRVCLVPNVRSRTKTIFSVMPLAVVGTEETSGLRLLPPFGPPSESPSSSLSRKVLSKAAASKRVSLQLKCSRERGLWASASPQMYSRRPRLPCSKAGDFGCWLRWWGARRSPMRGRPTNRRKSRLYSRCL